MKSPGGVGNKPRSVVAALAAAVAVLTAVALFGARLRGDPPDTTAAPPPPEPSSLQAAPPDVTWEGVAGVELPVSRTHGPRDTDNDRATGFSDSELGAALAAVHILVRSGANVGPDIYEPTITQQITGANAAALKVLTDQQYQQLREASGVEDGAPLPGGNAEVLGYRIVAFAGDTATVEVMMTAPDLAGQVVIFDVALQRSAEDWQVIAPPRGDWGGAAAVTLSATPEGMLSYGENG